jgi:hypothetical protein
MGPARIADHERRRKQNGQRLVELEIPERHEIEEGRTESSSERRT